MKHAVAKRLLDYLAQAEHRDTAVIRFRSPEQLEALFQEAGVPLSLAAPQPAHSEETLLEAVQVILDHSVQTQHPFFFNQNFAGADPIAVLGDWLGATLNTTNATYEAAPVFTLMEQHLVNRLTELAGFQDAEGIFGAGGSLSNLYALHLARHRAFPHANEEGLPPSTKLVAFTSEHSHYSLKKAVALLGLGYQSLRTVACDERGRMVPEALEEEILQAQQSGETPFFINATAGTTVTAAFDPLPPLAQLAQQHDIWLHVDGCYGGSALFSDKLRHWMEGIEQADSLSWNLHKMMGITQQCSALLVAQKGLLQSCFATKAKYLFQPDKEYAELDTGDRHFQCARRVDVAKLWLTWKYRGDAGFASRVERAVEHANHFTEMINTDPEKRFVCAIPPSFTNVCFWWLPPTLRNRQPEEWSETEKQQLHQIAPSIKRKMQTHGTAMLGFQTLNGYPNFFRMICINPAVDKRDLQNVLKLLDCYGNETLQELRIEA